MGLLIRLWFGIGGFYYLWVSYRLLTNPYVGCALIHWKPFGRLIDLCDSFGNKWAALVIALFALLLLIIAFWPKRQKAAASGGN